MHTLQTDEKFEHNGYTVTRLGAGAKGSESNWALIQVAQKSDATPDDTKGRIHFWVKAGHTFSVGDAGYNITNSTRESTTFEQTDGSEVGACK